jgi:hypothetical protein
MSEPSTMTPSLPAPGSTRVPTPKERERQQRIIDELFYEQDVEVMSVNYRHGIWRSVAILLRSLVFSRGDVAPISRVLVPGATVGIAFFRNESNAIKQAAAMVTVDHLLELDLHSLAFVRKALGWRGLVRETLHFTRAAISTRGGRYAGRLTHPLLGWLLYRTFQSLLLGRNDVSLITTNMQHPASVGVAWAAQGTTNHSDFLEHSTTPRIVVRERGYRRVYVNFEHTRNLLIECGFESTSIQVMRSVSLPVLPPGGGTIRKVGICINFFDSLEAIKDVTQVLQDRGIAVAYRIHDADPRLSDLKRLAGERRVSLSDARHSNISAFLKTVDLIIAGNSNVIADALIAGVPPLYYWSGSPDMQDYYGLVSYHRIPNASNKEALARVIDEMLEKTIAR